MTLFKNLLIFIFLLTINIALPLSVNASDTFDLVTPEGDLLENIEYTIGGDNSTVTPEKEASFYSIPKKIENLENNIIENRTIFGNDNRKFVNNTSIYPYSAVVFLLMRYGDTYWVGSGNIISDNYVLTAAHNIYNKRYGRYADSVEVIPGAFPSGNYEIGSYFGKTTGVPIVTTDWANTYNAKYDIGLIKLNKNIGSKTAHFGFTTTISKKTTLTGFHHDKETYTGQPRMTTETRNYEHINSDFINYKLDNTGGSSGSGIYYDTLGPRLIYGVNAYGWDEDYYIYPENSNAYNSAVRITPEWFNFIGTTAKITPNAKKADKMVTIKSPNYTIWQNFVNWKKKSDTSNKKDKAYRVKYTYDHFNGETYYSLYDSNNNWQGYINKTGVQELVAEKFDKNVSVRSETYNIWQNFFWKKKSDTKGKLGRVYKAKYKYKHSNGDTYYSLYDGNGTWQGYINASGTVEMNAVSYNKKVTITKSTYNIWGNFFFNTKNGHTSNHVGKTYNAKYVYTLGDGVKYYSLYNGNTWLGYLNTGATQMARSMWENNDDDKYEEPTNTEELSNEDGNIDPIELENDSVIESSTDSSTIDILESSSSNDHTLESSLDE